MVLTRNMLEAPDIWEGTTPAWRARRGRNLGTRSILAFYFCNFTRTIVKLKAKISSERRITFLPVRGL